MKEKKIIKPKIDYLKVFTELIKDQIIYGGKKYALNDKKESTDVLFEKHGKNWLFGTMDKYCFRYKNLIREEDLLKIAAYSYVLWLKRGFHVQKQGINDIIDTNVQIKENYFNDFINLIIEYFKINESKFSQIVDKISLTSAILELFSKSEWKDVEENLLIHIFCLVFYEWRFRFGNLEKHDTDTWNGEKK